MRSRPFGAGRKFSRSAARYDTRYVVKSEVTKTTIAERNKHPRTARRPIRIVHPVPTLYSIYDPAAADYLACTRLRPAESPDVVDNERSQYFEPTSVGDCFNNEQPETVETVENNVTDSAGDVNSTSEALERVTPVVLFKQAQRKLALRKEHLNSRAVKVDPVSDDAPTGEPDVGSTGRPVTEPVVKFRRRRRKSIAVAPTGDVTWVRKKAKRRHGLTPD